MIPINWPSDFTTSYLVNLANVAERITISRRPKIVLRKALSQMKPVKKWLVGSGIFSLLLSSFLVLMLWSTRIETTLHGVHTRLLVPTGTDALIGLHMYAGTGDLPVMPGFLDGPIIRRQAGGHWDAVWFCEDRVFRRHGTDPSLQLVCAGQRRSYPIHAEVGPVPAVFAAPPNMLVLSDIEGNAQFLTAALRELGVTGANGEWTYGTNTLVIAGDAVDRGRDVFSVLWHLYALNLEAQRSGGAVHLVLGNHEQYMLQGNLSRANREHIYALEQLGGQAAAFSADTVLGHWLRQQPVVIQAGDILITHGGISPDVAAAGLSVPQLNAAMRRYWRGETASTIELEAVIGRAGVSQYRGYFEPDEDLYGRAGAQDVSAVLNRYNARAVVVGHTQVERITQLFGGQVIAIDVNSDTAASQALLLEYGVPRVIPLITRRDLAASALRSRPLCLTGSEDWRTLWRFLQRGYQLSQLPFPYSPNTHPPAGN